MRVCVFMCSLLAMATPANAGQDVINLASGVNTVTLTKPAGTKLRFLIRHRLPRGNYKVVVEKRTIDIPPLKNPQTPITPASSGECEALDTIVTALYAAKDEIEIVAGAANIRSALEHKTCEGDADREDMLRTALAGTEFSVPGEYEVNAGEMVIVTITRGDKVWSHAFSSGARGTWLTTYGAAAIPDRSRRMHLKGNDAAGYVITPEAEPAGPRVLPSIFFSWLPASAERADWSHGPTAGIGVDDKAPSLFAGWSAMYNRNLMFVAGIALAQHKTLRGRYAPGEVLKENLLEEQLLQGTYKPSWLIGITFRFGDNPFSKPEPKKAPEKPAEKANGGQ